jgi:hypothetical protein
MSQIVVVLSYFHRKVGPSVFYSYPEDSLDRELSVKIANIMDLYNEGFFTHLVENLKTLNYYFEIHSEWARGNVEMLMVSTVIDQQISLETEERISELFVEFSEQLKSNKKIFTAFYINDIYHRKVDKEPLSFLEVKELVTISGTLIRAWLKELYLSILEMARDNTQEEEIVRITELMDFLRPRIQEFTKPHEMLEWEKKKYWEQLLEATRDFQDVNKANEMIKRFKNLTQEEKDKLRELFKRFSDGYGDQFPYPYISKPPSPPREAGAEAQLKPEYIAEKKEQESPPSCKHCGADIPNGALICPVCGKKI